jgi:hypothetical protein
MKLAIVGAGKMGGAVLSGAVRAGVFSAAEVGVYHPDADRRAVLAARFGVAELDDDDVHQAERVLVAVKPQSFEAVAPLIAQRHGSFVSLMAGVTTGTLAKRLGSRKVVRAMPNLGAAVGASATALAWHPETPEADRDFARQLFRAVGTVHEVAESLFDAYTGLAGSGPAFAAVVAEALADGDRSPARDPRARRPEGRGGLAGRYRHRRRARPGAPPRPLRRHGRDRRGRRPRAGVGLRPGGRMTPRPVPPRSRRPAGLALALAFLTVVQFAWANEYFPAAEGLSWTYSSGETQIMTGPRDLSGTPVMVLTHYLGGVPVSEDYLVYAPDGVWSVGTASGGAIVRYDPPLLVYGPAPLEPGASWTSTTDVGGVSITITSEVVGLRGVQTPAGRFNAMQIRQRTVTSTGAQTRLDLYVVPSVGVVRFVTSDGTTIDLIERVF